MSYIHFENMDCTINIAMVMVKFSLHCKQNGLETDYCFIDGLNT